MDPDRDVKKHIAEEAGYDQSSAFPTLVASKRPSHHGSNETVNFKLKFIFFTINIK